VLPLAEFIDDSSDPRALFTDLQEIAQGESGLVYSACTTPTVASQFRPPTPTSPVSELFPEEDGAEDEGLVQSKRGLVAIKCVPLLRGRTEKLAHLRRELELARVLRHANVLRMERLYVDVAEESLWIGMELMDRSLADVLAVVGEEVGSALVALEAQEDGGGGSSSGPGGDAEVVEMSETMVARFVRDVSDIPFIG
jgi:serine/threonine protein kinase